MITLDGEVIFQRAGEDDDFVAVGGEVACEQAADMSRAAWDYDFHGGGRSS